VIEINGIEGVILDDIISDAKVIASRYCIITNDPKVHVVECSQYEDHVVADVVVIDGSSVLNHHTIQ